MFRIKRVVKGKGGVGVGGGGEGVGVRICLEYKEWLKEKEGLEWEEGGG